MFVPVRRRDPDGFQPPLLTRAYSKEETEQELDPIKDLAAGGFRHDLEWVDA